MAILFIKTVTIEAPLPFTDAEAEAFIEVVDLTLDDAIQAAVMGVIDAARSDKVPLADVARVIVSD